MNFFRLSVSLLFVICLLPAPSRSQHSYLPYGSISTHILDRMEIKSGHIANDYFHTSNKSYRRKAIAEYADSMNTFPFSSFSVQDVFNLKYLQADNFEWSKSNEGNASFNVFNTGFYRKKAALYDVQIPDFNLVVNPVVYINMTNEKVNAKIDRAFINTRGAEIRGNITDKIGFYSLACDEVIAPMSNIMDVFIRDSVIPGGGYYKTYEGNYGYFVYNAYVTFSPNKYMDWQFGHGRNFIGDGYRTFIMSNYAHDYNFLRLNTRIWKINYTNIFSQQKDFRTVQTYIVSPTHYTATHHLSVDVTNKLNIGGFESIIFQRDSGHAETGFDVNYLNPIIFYKAIENGLNSTDKAVLGANIKYNFATHFSAYGQFVLSEFVFTELTKDRGWWGNKHAGQLGLKYIDAFHVSNFDLQLEYNYARPYMYTSYTNRQTYSNYGQAMAHPLGANFREVVSIVRYQPQKRTWLLGKLVWANYGEDTAGSNYGKDIRKSYQSGRPSEFGNNIGQGINCTLLILDFTASYMLRHNLFFDIGFRYRTVESTLKQFERNNAFFSVGIRLNAAQRFYDF